MVGNLCCSSTRIVRPLGSETSVGCGSLTLRISLFTGTRFKRWTLDGNCLASPVAGCWATAMAALSPAISTTDKHFFSMVISSLPCGAAAGTSSGCGDHDGSMRGYQVLLRGLLDLIGGDGTKLVIGRVDQVRIVIKNGKSSNLIGQSQGGRAGLNLLA